LNGFSNFSISRLCFGEARGTALFACTLRMPARGKAAQRSAAGRTEHPPSTFIEEWGYKKFRVGWATRAGNPLITDIHVFRSLAEATADYVIFPLGLSKADERTNVLV
jgi:hypothetical protein